MFTLKLTEAELETIAAAMEDYKHYDLDEDRETTEELFGGISVNERCSSINNKIADAYKR